MEFVGGQSSRGNFFGTVIPSGNNSAGNLPGGNTLGAIFRVVIFQGEFVRGNFPLTVAFMDT